MTEKPYLSTEKVYSRFEELYGETTEQQKKRYDDLFSDFKKAFGKNCAYFASSSGRVEVCGNHTDHNGGKVVSMAISLDTVAAFLPTDDGVIRVKSEGYPEMAVDLKSLPAEKKGTSAALIRGVAEGLKNFGYKIGGFIALMTSNVVGGAGISSSAAFEVLIAEILSFLYNGGKATNEEKAKVSQYSESVFFGKPCGLLDQTAIAYGGLNKLDFSDKTRIKVEGIDADLSGYAFVLINTGGSHANLTEQYAAIPKEMFSVAKLFGKERLIEVPESEFYKKLPSVIGKVPDRAILRAVHFYEENKRVDALFEGLSHGDYGALYKSVKESGLSSLWLLQNCRVDGESSQLIPLALAVSSKYLSGGVNRVHGGGFAGTILNIVKKENLENFIEKTSAIYGVSAVIPLNLRTVGTTVL